MNPHGLAVPFPSPAALPCDDCGLTIEKRSPALFNAGQELVHWVCPVKPEPGSIRNEVVNTLEDLEALPLHSMVGVELPDGLAVFERVDEFGWHKLKKIGTMYTAAGVFSLGVVYLLWREAS